MIGLVLAVAGAYGVHLLYTSMVFSWRGIRPGPRAAARVRRPVSAPRRELVLAGASLGALGGAAGWAVFGGLLPSLGAALTTGTVPVLAARSRARAAKAQARDAWPRLLEELRIKTTTLGRSIPQALFEVGRGAPAEMQPAFEVARREWLLSTDFERTLDLLRARLDDATADAVCETLLVAHQIGGNDVDRCLAALIEDRAMDLQGRKDAIARQAGARFARSFTVVVPVLMALVGMSIGDGRAAYSTPTGQVLVVVGIALMAACWIWAGRIMRLPDERRVFTGAPS